MSYAHFDSPVDCPECGHATSELCEAMSRQTGERVLMCQGCYDEAEEWKLNEECGESSGYDDEAPLDPAFWI